MVNIKQIKNNYTFTLHKLNMDILGEIPIEFCDSFTRGIDSIDEIAFTIPKYYFSRDNLKKTIHPLFFEVKEERIICVDNKECFVIKDIDDSDGLKKEIKAKSREVKLNKLDIEVEDIAFQIYTTNIENGIYSLNDYMKEETGWSFGQVDESVAYDISSDGVKTEKLRIQESINSNWYDFLTDDIREQFDCVVTFDTYNKKVNLLDYDSFGDNIQLYLSHDNYIKSLKKSTSTQDIVTRLKLVGNEEMDIISATVTGYPYIENYSYFIENGEMSEELEEQMNKYQFIVKVRNEQWKELSDLKIIKNSELTDKKSEMAQVYAEINAKERIKETYSTNNDDKNYAKTVAELTTLYDKKDIVESEVMALEQEIANLQSSIDNINILCKRETATDEHGYLIFNEQTLEELKEFVYYDTYTNSSFLNVDDLIKTGERELSLSCKPTYSWSLDSVNFLRRIIDNGFRQHWKGELSLGDIIVLYDKENENEELIYFVGYTQNFKDESLSLDLSNKKTKEDKQRTIMNYVNDANKAMRKLKNKEYLFIQQKYNRINLPKELISRGNNG